MRSLLLLTIFATGTNGSTMCQENYNSTVTISDGTHMKVKFELCKGWPKDGNLTIVPPGGYSISKDAAASGSGVTGGLSVLVNDENITIRRDGSGDAIGENSDGHAVEIEITGVIKTPVPMAPYRGNSADFAYVVSGQSGPVVTTTIEVTGVTETDLKADDEAQASLVGAVAASSAVGASLVSLTKIGDTLITRRRLESEELTLTFELKTGSAEAAKSLKQKLESTTFVSSVNALLAGTGIEVTGSPKAAIAGALAAVGNSTSTGNNSNDASTEKEEEIAEPKVQKNWSLDWSGYGGNCTKDGDDVTIAPGGGGAKRVQVATCTGDGDTVTLFCQVDSTSAGNGTTLQSHYTYTTQSHTIQRDGPPVTSGCSVITDVRGRARPNDGSCCFE